MTRLLFTERARRDLLDIWAHVALRSPAAADRILDRIADRCTILRTFPAAGPVRPDIRPGTRVLVVDRWLVLYRQIEDDVQVVRIVDGARDLARLDWPTD
ncbi:type II toxin-antitoxin system RelE/ParE family toxin [Methyloraptor flagellatus]|uniref:Type II toxin-antitoxin system RelE/ParE family toxin n=1 Tax=Methyloraptor flagellatus TaxID=3162530 RepID=A0AAU7XE63_9HYPH